MARRSRHIVSKQGGFTLFEVVVAVALLGMILAAAFGLVGAGLGALRTSREYTRAVLLAKRKLYESSLAKPQAGVRDQGSEGTLRWSAEVVSEDGYGGELPAELLRLRVRVSWAGRSKEKIVEMVSLAARVDDAKLPAVIVPGATIPGGVRQ